MCTQENKWDIASFPVITQAELVENLDEILEQINRGDDPFLILEETGAKLVLIGCNDYWEHFGLLYPEGEKERIEELCRRNSEL